MKSFIKWAGGKALLTKHISFNMPEFTKKQEFNYFEPFLGGGSVFINVALNYPNCKNFYLNDTNKDLLDCWITIKDHFETFSKKLMLLQERYNNLSNLENKEEFYLELRKIFNKKDFESIADKSAVFIFLNKACFNGLYRLNKKKEFNCSFGKHEKLNFEMDNLIELNQLLNSVNVFFSNHDYLFFCAEHITQENCIPSFFYFDPPYISYKAVDRIYSDESFNKDNQKNLFNCLNTLTNFDISWLLSNADISDTRAEFCNYNVLVLKVANRLNSDLKGRKRGELLISNYSLPNQPGVEKNTLDEILITGDFPESLFYITVDYFTHLGYDMGNLKLIEFINSIKESKPDIFKEFRKHIYMLSESYISKFHSEIK